MSKVRFLDIGETVKEGDEQYFFSLKKEDYVWDFVATQNIGKKAVLTKLFRRKIENDDWGGWRPIEGWRPLKDKEKINKETDLHILIWSNLPNTKNLAIPSNCRTLGGDTPEYYDEKWRGQRKYLFIRPVRMADDEIAPGKPQENDERLFVDEINYSKAPDRKAWFELGKTLCDGSAGVSSSETWQERLKKVVSDNKKRKIKELTSQEKESLNLLFDEINHPPETLQKAMFELGKTLCGDLHAHYSFNELTDDLKRQVCIHEIEHLKIEIRNYPNLSNKELADMFQKTLERILQIEVKTKKELPYSTLNLSHKDRARLAEADRILSNRKKEVEVSFDDQYGEEFEIE